VKDGGRGHSLPGIRAARTGEMIAALSESVLHGSSPGEELAAEVLRPDEYAHQGIGDEYIFYKFLVKTIIGNARHEIAQFFILHVSSFA
jgi:hypothetical protein